jgi:hypothetical protein
MAYASDILFVVTLGLSKITTAVFYMTLFKQKLRVVIRGLLVGGCIWVIVSVILLAVRCGHQPWLDIDAQCGGLVWSMLSKATHADGHSSKGGRQSPRSILLSRSFSSSTPPERYTASRSQRDKKSSYSVLSAVEPCKNPSLFHDPADESRLIPLSATHLYYVKVQLDSNNPILYGAFASITAELYLAMSVVCLVASFMKPVLAVYVDEYGIAYTDDVSPPNSKLRSHTSSDSRSRRLRRSETEYDRGWEWMPGRTIPAASGGRIMKTVQISVSDGPMELERREPEVINGV